MELASGSSYSVTLKHRGKTISSPLETDRLPLDVGPAHLEALRQQFKASSSEADVRHIFEVHIVTNRQDKQPTPPLLLQYWFDAESDDFTLVGIQY